LKGADWIATEGDRKLRNKMKFRFTPKLRRARPGLEERTFTIHQLWKDDDTKSSEITHLFDRSYGYRSPRELAWHIADRFAVAPRAVELEQT
jgi:hypothetical protein